MKKAPKWNWEDAYKRRPKVAGVQFEHLTHKEQEEIKTWLYKTYGKSTLHTWYIDVQPGMTDLVMNEEIMTVYLLKWGSK